MPIYDCFCLDCADPHQNREGDHDFLTVGRTERIDLSGGSRRGADFTPNRNVCFRVDYEYQPRLTHARGHCTPNKTDNGATVPTKAPQPTDLKSKDQMQSIKLGASHAVYFDSAAQTQAIKTVTAEQIPQQWLGCSPLACQGRRNSNHRI